MARKHVRPGEKVGLELTGAEAKLLLGEILLPDPDVEAVIKSTPPGEPVLLTLDDLDDLAGHVAAAANHARDARLRKKLDTVSSKIDRLLGEYTDEVPLTTLNIQDARREKQLAVQAAELAEWAATILVGAERLGIKSKAVSKFPLPEGELAVLLMSPGTDEKVREKLAAKNPKLTVGEVGGMLIGVAGEMLDTSGMQGFALVLTAKRLVDCLEAEVTGAMDPPRAEPSGSVYRLRITLAGVEPPVWRLVEVPDCSLGRLHGVIQAAMGWEGCHLHQFTVNGKNYVRRGKARVFRGCDPHPATRRSGRKQSERRWR
jgi:hypothetical protein